MRIAFVISPNMLATSLTNAFELFFAAKQINERNRQSQLEVELIKVAESAGRIQMPSGLVLEADLDLIKKPMDMIYLPALWRNPRPIIKKSPKLIEWVRWQYEHGAIINSTGTGVSFIAEAGLLDNKPATTHWHHFDQFAQDYPNAELKRQHFITNAGKIFCAASINALTDLTLHHVHRFFGKPTADHLSQHFSHEVRQPFDQLSFTQDENSNHPDEDILQAQIWIQNNLNKPTITVKLIADLFGMSQRNFTRRFRKASNTTALKYIQTQRLSEAKNLLQNSNLSISEIAYRVGYIDVSYFTKLFKQFVSLTPKKYRDQVRAKLFNSRTVNTQQKSIKLDS